MAGANQTTTWTPDELDRIGAAEELRLTSRRPDGSLRPYVTMWVVRAGEWPAGTVRRATAAAPAGSAGIERDVSFADVARTSRATSTPPTTPSTTVTARRSSARSPARTLTA